MTLGARLLMLIAVALLPPLAIQAWNGVEMLHERQAVLHGAAIAQSRAVQAGMVRIAEGVRQLLTALAQAPQIRTGDVAGCTAYLQDVAPHLTPYSLLAVNDPSGAILCSSAGAERGAYSNGERAYHQRAMSSGGFVAGDLVIGVVTDKLSLHFAVPFHRMDGSVGGIVLASVDQGWLSTQLAAAALPPGAEALILDPSGNLVAAVENGRPALADLIGKPVPQAFRAALDVSRPATAAVMGLEGRRRLLGVMPADPELVGIRVAVALDEEQAFADLRAGNDRTVIGLLIGVMLALLAARSGASRFVLAPLRGLVQAADRVGRGELGAHADLGDRSGAIRDVGAAFDRMSAALAAREDERDRAELARRQGEARLGRILAATPAGLLELDQQGRIVFANAAAERLLGPGTLVGRSCDDPAWFPGQAQRAVIEGAGQQPERALIASALEGNTVIDQERAITTLDGRRAVLLVDIVPIHAPEGAVIGALAAIQDVTVRQAQAKALEESRERLRLAQRAGRVGTFELDPASKTLWVSEEFCGLWGIPVCETVRLETLLAMLEPEDHIVVARSHQSITTDPLSYIEYRIRRGDTGELRWLARRGEPAKRADHQAAEVFVGVVYDVTDRKRMEGELRQLNEALERRVMERTGELMAAEETLRQSQKMEAVGQLTGGIAHDFNNMLQAIGGSLEMIRRRVEQGRAGEATRFLDSAGKTVERAAGLTHRLLAFARRQALQPRSVEPNALVADLEELIRRTVGSTVLVELRLGPVSPILCDPNQLENVLLNLAINARDAMPDGGKITIGTGDVVLGAEDVAGQQGISGGAFVEISVSDTGTGMDEATRARAFEPFYTTKPIGQGTGLGLSQVYGFVRQSEGIVRLDSAVGAGTIVRLYLPRQRSERDPKPPEPLSLSGTVLLLEDESELRAIAAQHLRELGYRVLEAADGPRALDVLHGAGAISLLVTDVGLPGGLNGRQVADAARERRPGLPVLFMTGYSGTALAEALGPGMEVIAKPFTLDALSRRICAMLASIP